MQNVFFLRYREVICLKGTEETSLQVYLFHFVLNVALSADGELDISGLECALGDVELDPPAQLLTRHNVVIVQFNHKGLDCGTPKDPHAGGKPSGYQVQLRVSI